MPYDILNRSRRRLQAGRRERHKFANRVEEMRVAGSHAGVL
jgi:hypothetical protein